jgi:hypothetical protein
MSPKEALDGAHTTHHVEEARTSGFEEKPKANVDNIRNDAAVNILEQYAGNPEWSDVEEKYLVRKIDRKLMPLMFLTYGLQYYDKSMLSQAVGLQTARSACDCLTGGRRSSDCVKACISKPGTDSASHRPSSTSVSLLGPCRQS